MPRLPDPFRSAHRPGRAWAGLLGAMVAMATTLPARAADVQKGAQLYRQHCVACHGGDGQPVVPGATDFTRPSSLLKPDLTLIGVIRAGKGAMPAYQGLLRDREMADIVAHLRMAGR